MKKMILNKTIAFIYVIEFQKRGLFHAHILLILDFMNKLQISADIDSIICVEILSQIDHSELYDTMMSFMLHRSYDTAKSTASYMKNDIYSKRFSKSFSDETLSKVNNYSLYRRRNDEITIYKHDHILTNAYVILYNSYLSVKFDCHINVEIVTFITAVKYLFKYVYKDHD